MPATASSRHQVPPEFAARLDRDTRELRAAHEEATGLARAFLADSRPVAEPAGCPFASALLRALKRLQEASAWAAESEQEARQA